jgi:hypothetical protein
VVSDEEKRFAFQRKVRELANRLGVKPELIDTRISFGFTSSKSPEEEHELAKAKGLQIAAEHAANELLPQVKTRRDLEEFEKALDAGIEKSPTVARKQWKKINRDLPRGGGPGRKPKLDFDQCRRACQEMLFEIGQGASSAKEAAAKVSERSYELFRKHVGRRTFETIWSERQKYLFPEK